MDALPRRAAQVLHARRARPGLLHGTAGLVLLLFVLALYARLLFTNRVLASGDILHYFYPYREMAAAALRDGHIPLWNPYIFLGAPFLANIQAAVLYPLHWLLSWLSVTQQIYWSAALHTWLLGLGGYFLVRRRHGSFWSALTAGLVLAGSGFYGGLMGHINQMNGAAWLPWSILALDAVHAGGHSFLRRVVRSVVLLAAVTALMVLAGHVQTVYINLAGLGLWAVWPGVRALARRRYHTGAGIAVVRVGVYAGGVALGLLISGAQLLPTVELMGLGLRSGGLSYAEASSFSLRPLLLPWTLLPSYGLVDLSVVFGTLGYTEFVAYVGLPATVLALLGAWRGRGPLRRGGLMLVFAGLFLAAGRWNPFYFVLYSLVPGFDLFRAPARWMMLYTLGMALLAAAGLAWLLARPRLQMRAGLRLTPLLVALVAVDLILAARALPHSHPTAPQAVYDLRTAPAHLHTDPQRDRPAPAAAGRYLSMSTLTFDPGDMADYRRILRESTPPRLDEDAFQELIIAFKSQEILAPNLSMLWRIPAVDGFDGGLLPLGRYNRLLSLLIPPDQLVADGRIREQIDQVPPANLLRLLGVESVITDKLRDLWFDGVYYDRQIGARLEGGVAPALAVPAPQPFSATHVDLIGYLQGAPADLAAAASAALPALDVRVESADGPAVDLSLLAGRDWADGALDSDLAIVAGATVAYQDLDGGRQEYRSRLAMPAPTTPTTITLTAPTPGLTAAIQAITLYDQRTGMFTPLLPSDRGRFALVHSGDVKIYRLTNGPARAYLAHAWRPAASPDDALTLLADPAVDPLRVPVVEGAVEARPAVDSDTPADQRVEIVAYDPEHVEVAVSAEQPGLLVLSDSYYPGWIARVDGVEAPIVPANVLARGVFVPPGDHTVTFTYAPASWRWGRLLSAAGLLLWLVGLAAVVRRPSGREHG